MNKSMAALVAVGVSVVLGLFCLNKLVGYNSSQHWQVHQSALSGKLTVIDRGGPYAKMFGTVWTYDRTLEDTYDHVDNDDDRVEVSFNDNGTAKLNAYIKVALPTSDEQRHRLFLEFKDNDSLKTAIRAWVVQVMKQSGPVMSATEHQAVRQAEFNSIVENQIKQGLFKTRRTTIQVDTGDATPGVGGDKTTVQANEIVLDANGLPTVVQTSPLATYGIAVLQFNITGTEYDQQTLVQFAAKKEAYLNAERSKAQRQEEVQARLMIEERGLRQIAEIEATENQKKTQAVIAATMAAEVAEVNKRQAVTAASQRVEVAEQTRLETEKLREIAAIEAETAELKKQATIAAAEARQQELELGGGISEETRILAEIKMKRDIGVAQYLATLASPATVMTGGEGGGIEGNLMSMALLKYMGILDMGPRVAARTVNVDNSTGGVIRVAQ